MLYPLSFQPLYKSYIWGGRRLETTLGKKLPQTGNYAESWEICDYGSDQSVVTGGPLAGMTLSELVVQYPKELLGRHSSWSKFPLLIKFLDTARIISIQVHPNDAYAAKLNPPDSGKSEAWIVVDAEPESRIYAGLNEGVTRQDLEAALREGRCQECLHSFRPQVGDCVYLPAGIVHALGAGLVVAEIQQASNATFRLFDWNRLGIDGKPRPLHIQQALEVINYTAGPIKPLRKPTVDAAGMEHLLECERFVINRSLLNGNDCTIGGDDRAHILIVLDGLVHVENNPKGKQVDIGNTILLPACLGPVQLTSEKRAVFLDIFLP